MLTETILIELNTRFFQDFYGLPADKLTELERLCSAYKVTWLYLFYVPEIVQKGIMEHIAMDFALLRSDLPSYQRKPLPLGGG